MDSSEKDEIRSVSPHCPKPNEPEEPQGSAVQSHCTGYCPAKGEMQDVIITREMEEEEQRLMEEGERKERALMAKERESWEKDSHEMRFRRLQHLLEKSNIYSKFLLTKMEQQQQEEKQKKEKTEKRGRKRQLESSDTATGKGQRRKREREDYKIADVISKEEILSQAKRATNKKEGPLDVMDIEMMSSSNAEIKGRLSAVVRANSKLLLDQCRMINGEAVPLHQPQLFTGGVMRSYQVEGMEWLRMLWENGINGILADEMGLGKTVQCIALIAMMVEKKVPGPFLVVAPLSTLPNWISEFKRFTPDIPIQLYHGTQKERVGLIKTICKPQGPLSICPVVVTSYEVAMIDRKYLQRFQWKYMIVDEGHRIKNLKGKLVQELKKLPSDNKLLLTGTPLQNNLSELWSLLNFLLPDVFDDLKSFESWFDISMFDSDVEDIVANEQKQKILNMLHQILTPFLLRRLKSDVVLEVPPKKEIVVYAPLTSKQESLYTAVVNGTIAQMLGKEKVKDAPVDLSASGRPRRRVRKVMDYSEKEAGMPLSPEKLLEKLEKQFVQQNHSVADVQMPNNTQISLKLQNILMLLKKCCNHPYLVEYPLDPVTQEFKIDEQLVETSGKFLILDRMLPELKKRGHKVLIFSQMTSILDLLMDYCYLRDIQYSRLDGTMSYALRDENMKKFHSDPEVFLFLLSTRAGGLGINLTSADTVIIFDSDWNPQADLQAQDRCHRIGQTKPVVVYRLVTANTIDQKIFERACAKRKLEKMVIHRKKFKGGQAELTQQSKSCIDLDELMELLKSRDYEREVKSTKEKVISDKDLELLLNRSDLCHPKVKQSRQKTGVFKVLEPNESPDVSLMENSWMK